MFRQRSAGILMHLSSLPSPYGIGDLGPQARDFVDFLKAAHQSFWQVLPLNVTTAETGFSPYNCLSRLCRQSPIHQPRATVGRRLVGQERSAPTSVLPR